MGVSVMEAGPQHSDAMLWQRVTRGDQADHADAVADRLDGERRGAELRAAVERLPRREREVIELCVWGGLDHASAAVALGVRRGTIKSRLHRARRRLALQLGNGQFRDGELGTGSARWTIR